MTNFDFLKKDVKFDSFADVAITAEKLYQVDIASCIFNIRRAAEFAVKWMYSVDGSLVMPYQDTFVTLINTVEFKDIVGNDIFRRLDFIRLVGNSSAHSARNIKPEQAELALENLFYFLDFVAYCYADDYEEQTFNAELLKAEPTPVAPIPEITVDIEKLIEENNKLRCTNPLCAYRVSGALTTFFTELNAKGIGESICRQLYDELNITNPVDVLKLTKEDFKSLTGFKDAAAKAAMNTIQDILSKPRTIPSILSALGIDCLRASTATKILDVISIDELINLID